MSDGRLNNRVWQIEQGVVQIKKDVGYLKKRSAPE
jgi:hypothetical protein